MPNYPMAKRVIMQTIQIIKLPTKKPVVIDAGTKHVIVLEHGKARRPTRYWWGEPPGPLDLFGKPITDQFYHGTVKKSSRPLMLPQTVTYANGRTEYYQPHSSGIMAPESWQAHGLRRRFEYNRFKKTPEGWLKIWD